MRRFVQQDLLITFFFKLYDASFTKFRKETYFDTLKELKDRKEQEAAAKVAAHFEEKERKHQDRLDRKKKRLKKKEGEKGGVHAQIIKWQFQV